MTSSLALVCVVVPWPSIWYVAAAASLTFPFSVATIFCAALAPMPGIVWSVVASLVSMALAIVGTGIMRAAAALVGPMPSTCTNCSKNVRSVRCSKPTRTGSGCRSVTE